MIRLLRETLNPTIYHGLGRRPPFFEGWYFKLVDASGAYRYAIIPGVFLGREEARNHAFVQVLDGASGAMTYHRYPLSQFWAAEDVFDVRIGPNRFSAHGLELDIRAPDRIVCGRVTFPRIVPWPVSLLSPGIMGPFGWVPFMECYHGVVSMDHRLEGKLEIDGRLVNWNGGRGYIEKDWGRSFPSAWIWFQSNHFGHAETSLTASVAVIPGAGLSFNGFIIGLWHEGRLYRFATYTGARIERLTIQDSEVQWVVRDRRRRGGYALEMVVRRAEAGLLRAPATVDMDRRVAETISATVAVRLYDLSAGQAHLMYEDMGHHAGLEVVGNVKKLAHVEPPIPHPSAPKSLQPG